MVALRWLKYGGEDFRVVCENAGWDYLAVRALAMNAILSGARGRKGSPRRHPPGLPSGLPPRGQKWPRGGGEYSAVYPPQPIATES